MLEFIAYNFKLDILDDQINIACVLGSSCTHRMRKRLQPANYICMSDI
jgi:hypothetical protein